MSDDLDADAIRARIEHWRHFVSRRTVRDDVDEAHTPLAKPVLRTEPPRPPGFPTGLRPHGPEPVSARDLAGPDHNGGRAGLPPQFDDRAVAAARRAAKASHAAPPGKRRFHAGEVAVWVLTAAIVVAVSLLVSRAVP